MFDTRIEILEYAEERDEYNDRSKVLQIVTVCYAQRTESGGRENLYAGRMIRDDRYLRKIVSIHEETRRWRLHLKCTKSDADSQG